MIHTVVLKSLLIMQRCIKNDPVTDEEEVYDPHNDVEMPIDDAEMHKSDPVTQIEVEPHHGA